MDGADKPVALVTGSSRGIGRDIALRLAKEGYALVLNGVRPLDEGNSKKGAYEVRETIRNAGGVAEFCRADISAAEDRQALVDFAEQTFGRIDLLVNNSGIEPPSLDMLESTQARYDLVMSVNLRGPYFLTQQVANRMIAWRKERRIEKGRILFVTSVQGYMTNPRGAEYCMTKAALGMASKIFAHRLGEHDIPVIEISPGVFHSDMADKHQENIDRKIAEGWLVTSRWGAQHEMGALVAAFARGDLDYSTGSQIELAGGMGMRRL